VQTLAFLDDINSKHLGNFVLVTIGEHRISTRKITFDDDYYKPILLNIPSISESLDIENRKYKISSVSLSISDYVEDGERFSDHLNTLMNQEVNIWFASQSSKTLDSSECYKAGTFIVRSFSQNQDKVTLNCEDLSQDKLHKDLPLETVSDSEDILEKYRAKPKPMVFGTVDKSPCIIENIEEEQIILSDYNPSDFNFNTDNFQIGESNNYNNSPLFIFYNESYVNIAEQKATGEGLSNTGNSNFSREDGYIRLETDIEDNDTSLGNLRIISPRKGKRVLSLGVDSSEIAEINAMFAENILDDNIDTFGILAGELIDDDLGANNYNNFSNGTLDIDVGHSLNIHGTGTNPDVTWNYKFFRIYLEKISTINTSDIVTDEGGEEVDSYTYIYLRFRHSTGDNNEYPPIWGVGVSGTPQAFSDFSTPNNVGYPYLFSNKLAMAFDQEGDYNSISGNSAVISNFNWGITDTFDYIEIGYFKQVNTWLDDPNIILSVKGALYDTFVIHSAVIKGIDKYNFFVSATGRGGDNCTTSDIYSSILIDELDYDGSINLVDNSLGKYAFTIDKKINSKKLIEEVSASSGLFPYFKNGEFNVKSIKNIYLDSEIEPNKTINIDDILSYKFNRTKIEKVYNSGVNIKYHYDYGLKDFTKETGLILPNANMSLQDYVNETFGEDFDQDDVFESKYIRDPDTAENLAKYLAGLHANQHNLITIKLPLNYLTLELGDIIRLSGLIQNRKMFGEDYTKAEIRNGQQILPFFFIEQIKKNLDSVEIKLYQLHNFSDTVYEPELEQTKGCMDTNAVNYNQLATISADENTLGACYFPQTLLPPEITSPTQENIVIPDIEEVEVTTTSNNLIVSPVMNSTFDAVPSDGATDWQPTTDDYFFSETGVTQDQTLSVKTDNENQVVGCYLDGTHYGMTWGAYSEGDIYKVSLNIKRLSGDADTFYITIHHNDNIVDSIPITNNWESHEIDITLNTLNHKKLYIVMNESTIPSSFAIDNVIVQRVTTTEETITQQIINPELNITWNPSPNIIQPIPELGIPITAYYKLLIYEDVVTPDSTLLYESNEIPAIEGDAPVSHSLWLGDENIPHNTELLCMIIAVNPTQYNGAYVYNDTSSVWDNHPFNQDSFIFQWGEGISDQGTINGDVDLDGQLNVADIVTLVSHILGTNILEAGSDNFIAADMNGDGIVNVVDVVTLVEEILNPS